VTGLEGVAVVAAGLVAGMVNTVVGSGSLITFPTLLAVGYPAVLANVSNTVGLVPGAVSGAVGYRRELSGQRRRIVLLAVPAVLGGVTGAVLLLALPGDVFRSVVPALILLAVVLVLLQPRIARRRAAAGRRRDLPGPGLLVATYATAVYGGYFGAAQSVILLALLGITLDDHLQRLNGVKNVINALVNGVAAVLFMLVSDVAWTAVLLLLVGSVAGGQLGASYGRRIPADVLRLLIAGVGTVVAVVLLVT
jgi:uncharacterized membrane protein YfcA